jgi:hypothetical protein
MLTLLSVRNKTFMLNVIMLNVVMLSVVMLNVAAPLISHSPNTIQCNMLMSVGQMVSWQNGVAPLVFTLHSKIRASHIFIIRQLLNQPNQLRAVFPLGCVRP